MDVVFERKNISFVLSALRDNLLSFSHFEANFSSKFTTDSVEPSLALLKRINASSAKWPDSVLSKHNLKSFM